MINQSLTYFHSLCVCKDRRHLKGKKAEKRSRHLKFLPTPAEKKKRESESFQAENEWRERENSKKIRHSNEGEIDRPLNPTKRYNLF